MRRIGCFLSLMLVSTLLIQCAVHAWAKNEVDLNVIHRQILLSTVKITAELNGQTLRTGTGFFYRYRARSKKAYDFLITNRHVANGAKRLSFRFYGSKEGDSPNINLPLNAHIDCPEIGCVSYGHKNSSIDILAIPILVENRQFTSITDELIPNEGEIETTDPIVEVIFPGYPLGGSAADDIIPITRHGITATPLFLNYDNMPQFLIDGFCLDGNSGSPVFSFGSNRPLLLGVLSQTLKYPFSINEFVILKPSLDLGKIIKTSAIIETIEAWIKENGGL